MTTIRNQQYHMDPDLRRRVEDAVMKNVNGTVIKIIEMVRDKIERADYWERVYMVAWSRDYAHVEGHNFGTHRVCINSKGESMLVWGHYDLDHTTALRDCTDRAGHGAVEVEMKDPDADEGILDPEDEFARKIAEQERSEHPDSNRGPDGVLGNHFDDRGW